MDVTELYRRFPGIPADLRQESMLAQYALEMDPWLSQARQPSACARVHDVTNRYFLKLIGPLEIYGYGLATREATITWMRSMCEQLAESREAFDTDLRAENRR